MGGEIAVRPDAFDARPGGAHGRDEAGSRASRGRRHRDVRAETDAGHLLNDLVARLAVEALVDEPAAAVRDAVADLFGNPGLRRELIVAIRCRRKKWADPRRDRRRACAPRSAWRSRRIDKACSRPRA